MLNEKIDEYTILFQSIKSRPFTIKISYLFLLISYLLFILSSFGKYSHSESILIFEGFLFFYWFGWLFLEGDELNKRHIKFLTLFSLILILLNSLSSIILLNNASIIKSNVINSVFVLIFAKVSAFKLSKTYMKNN